MDAASLIKATMSVSLPDASGEVPEWVMLLPYGADRVVQTRDNRGPYKVAAAEELIKNSFAYAHHGKLPIDINHATDHAAPKGGEAPAHGWVVALEEREGGLFGKVEWNASGRELLQNKSYAGISPVFFTGDDKTVLVVGRASLTNTPNLLGMKSLNTEQAPEVGDMNWEDYLRDMLGLEASATADDIKNGLKSLKGGGKMKPEKMTELAEAAGLEAHAQIDDVIGAVQSVVASDADKDEMIKGLQSEIVELGKSIQKAQDDGKRGKAEAFVDGAIRDKTVGIKPMRETWISRHMEDPEGTEAEIRTLPRLGQTHTTDTPPEKTKTTKSLNAEEEAVAAQLGMSVEDFIKAQEEENA